MEGREREREVTSRERKRRRRRKKRKKGGIIKHDSSPFNLCWGFVAGRRPETEHETHTHLKH